MLKHWIQENVILPLNDLFTGQKIHKYLKFMLKSQYWTREQIDDFQNERLRALIHYAYHNVPFYHDVMIELGLTPDDIQTKEDLVKLPIINKETIRKEGLERFTSQSMPRKQMIIQGSSGSTGQPFSYYITKLSYSMNMAANLRLWYNFGWRLGDRYVKMSQNPRKSWLKRIQDRITHNLYIPTANLSDEHMQEIQQQVEDYKPVVIRCYPDPLFEMAQFRLRHQDAFTYSPLAIATTGSVLHYNKRTTIEKAFGCKVFDSYSCEGNSNVFECTTHECYHVSEEYGITEVLDDKNTPIQSGIGRVVSTDLWNYATVFIRYDVQDRVELYDKLCSCGRSHKAIKRILGRNNEVLETPSGRKYIVNHFTVFFNPAVTPELKDSIEQFQFIQHVDKSTTIRIVVNNRYDKKVENFLINYWSKEFEAPVDVQVVAHMPIMQNDKCRFIVVEK